MFELRVLSGLHQGAALPLFGERWSIGANEAADLALYDPGIEGRHASLRHLAGCWSVQAEEGLVCNSAGDTLAQIADLALNVPFSLAGIQICVCADGQPWPAQTQEPAPTAAPEPTPVSAAVSEPVLKARKPARKPMDPGRRRLFATLALVCLVILAIALNSGRDPQPQASLIPPEDLRTTLKTPFDVRQQLLKMLRERELATQLRLVAGNDFVALAGEASPEAVELAARMINRFREQFDTQVVIVNEVVERSDQLPFSIVQIIGGPKGHVVLDDGRRIFLGDEVDGLRLIAIDNSKVVFDGPRRYEVKW